MSDIYYDDHMVGIFSMVANFCYTSGFDKEWVNTFWEGLQELPSLYDEFIHYFNTGEVTGNFSLHGFSVLDAFIWHMNHYNLVHDAGKNGPMCDKKETVLRAFYTMIALYHEPERFISLLSQDGRMDRLY